MKPLKGASLCDFSQNIEMTKLTILTSNDCLFEMSFSAIEKSNSSETTKRSILMRFLPKGRNDKLLKTLIFTT